MSNIFSNLLRNLCFFIQLFKQISQYIRSWLEGGLTENVGSTTEMFLLAFSITKLMLNAYFVWLHKLALHSSINLGIAT